MLHELVISEANGRMIEPIGSLKQPWNTLLKRAPIQGRKETTDWNLKNYMKWISAEDRGVSLELNNAARSARDANSIDDVVQQQFR